MLSLSPVSLLPASAPLSDTHASRPKIRFLPSMTSKKNNQAALSIFVPAHNALATTASYYSLTNWKQNTPLLTQQQYYD
jgi:hypothetical protein